MRVVVPMPRLSDSMTEGAVTSWFRRVGETVAEGEPLAEIETGKSTVDLAAPAAGVLASIVVEGGAGPVPVGTVLAEVETDAAASVVAARAATGGVAASPSSAPAASAEGTREAASATTAGAAPLEAEAAASRAVGPATAGAATASAPLAGPAVAPAPLRVTAQTPSQTPSAADEARIPATPLARRMAAQSGIALSSLVPTGAGGKVCAADVEAALGRGAAARPAAQPAPHATSPQPPRPAAQPLPPGAMRVSRVHRTMASRMAEAKASIPHFYLWVDARVDHLLELRRHLQADGVQVSLNDFVVWAAAVALRHVPEANASWVEGSTDAVVRHDHVHIAIAVAVEDGLVAPVIRDVDKLGLAALGSAIRELAGRAREGKLTPQDHEGGTFTVSNLGMFGVQGMVAIVNPPQACILGVGAAEPRAVVDEGRVVPGTVMTLVLSADHRVIDGATGARFLAEVKRLLEEPARVLV